MLCTDALGRWWDLIFYVIEPDSPTLHSATVAPLDPLAPFACYKRTPLPGVADARLCPAATSHARASRSPAPPLHLARTPATAQWKCALPSVAVAHCRERCCLWLQDSQPQGTAGRRPSLWRILSKHASFDSLSSGLSSGLSSIAGALSRRRISGQRPKEPAPQP